MTRTYSVGVLALQGAFVEHIGHLEEAARQPHLAQYAFSVAAVRTLAELETCDALVIPGGESSAMSLIAERNGLLAPLRAFAAKKPVWGTCAGLIFLALAIANAKDFQQPLGGLDVEVTRNAFGRQLDSFEAKFDFSAFAPNLTNFTGVFIRAPVVSAVGTGSRRRPVGPKNIARGTIVETQCSNAAPVEILHTLDNGLVVAVRQGRVLGTSFHPELLHDVRFHAWFLAEFVVS